MPLMGQVKENGEYIVNSMILYTGEVKKIDPDSIVKGMPLMSQVKENGKYIVNSMIL